MKKYSHMLLIMLCITGLFAGTAGKIKGVVLDGNGDPLHGADVVIEGTTWGTQTDSLGYYYILGVRAGKYTVKCQYVGYAPSIKKDVQIRVGLTKKLNFNLVPDDTQLDTMEIEVGMPAKVNMDVTTSVRTIDMKTLEMQAVTECSDVLSSPAGVGAKKFGNALSGSVNIVYKNGDQEKPKGKYNTEEYSKIDENNFKTVKDNPLSTFSIDVDAASYANVRRFINQNRMPYKDAVRIEEMINYFSYDYELPADNEPFSINTEISICPWNEKNRLVHVGLQGKQLDKKEIVKSNIVFLLDVSGSMNRPNKLPLLKKSFKLLLNTLNDDDRIAIVVYAGAAGVVLPSTEVSDKKKIMASLESLRAGGSTAGGAGIKLAYEIAKNNLIKDGNNRIILATDGDFNVGTSSTSELVRMMEEKRKEGIFLTVLGFGMGNYKDGRMEEIADKGNGNYFYIDNILEAKKVLVTEITGTLFTIAKDVKIQIEFNPVKVKSYRLIGYENRILNKEDFDDDKKDAGELGAGHTVTALYEIVPADKDDAYSADDLKFQQMTTKNNAYDTDDLMFAKLRYKEPDEDKSKLIEVALKDESSSFAKASENFRFSAAVAEYGMLLRGSEFINTGSYEQVLDIARNSKGKDKFGYRAEFIQIVEKSELLTEK